ncbi:MAG: dihydroorotase [Sphingobacteriaceae bacterium]|jgi:dihydroorotase
MATLIKQATVLNSNSEYNNKKVDILIEGGKIVEIKKTISPKANFKIIEGDDLHVSIGWMDMQAVFCDPALEHKETIETGAKAASAGGFTAVCIHGYDQCSINNKSTVEYVLNKSDKLVDLFPIGSITVKTEGKELAEMYDMQLAGAKAFSDHKHPIMHAGVFMRAMQYANNINSFVIAHCNDTHLSHGGQMNEGSTSTSLGLKGMPAIAEEIMLERNISLLEYTGGKLHIPTISTAGSVELIKKAKANGLNITAGVAAINLMYDDSVLKDFDSNYKVDPPLRTKKDVEALRKAVDNGIIDVIVSDHNPQDSESKDLEFDLADFGIINLQTAFNCIAEAFKNKDIHKAIDALSLNPRNILGIEVPKFNEGEEANLTLFSLKQTSQLTEKNNQSRSKNSPFLNKTLQGKVIGVINGSKSFINA